MLTAAALIIGNEILSGRTKDANVSYLGERLHSCGIYLMETRIIRDEEAAIVKALNDLRKSHTYVFTTGGIGPTHDDITASSVAAAFGVPHEEHEEARRLLEDHYGPEGLTPARLRMACMPRGARLLDNPVSTIPGFCLENVYVMAGIPAIMQGMLEGILPSLKQEAPILSESVLCPFAESKIAEELEQIQDLFPEVEIGSYPFKKDNKPSTYLVARSQDTHALHQARRALEALVETLT